MRVLIDVSSAAKPNPTGIGRYAVELVRALSSQLANTDRAALAVRTSRWKSRHHLDALLQLPGVSGMHWLGPLALGLVPRIDLVHALGVALPSTYRLPRAVTIHDVYTMEHPGLAKAGWAEKRSAKTRVVAQRADYVFTVSEYVRQSVLSYFPFLGEDRVRVTYHGVDHTWLSPHNQPTDEAVLARYNLKPGYVLFVGIVEKRKNPETLVRAFAQAQLPPSCRLVFAGGRGHSQLDQAIADSGCADRVRVLGRVADDELPVLYRQAGVFCLPSRAEGFGIPIIEAMACGTPVITSTASACPEVAGEAGLCCDPDDTDAFAAHLERVINDRDYAKMLSNKSIQHASTFTWQRCAQQTRSGYQDLLRMGRRR